MPPRKRMKIDMQVFELLKETYRDGNQEITTSVNSNIENEDLDLIHKLSNEYNLPREWERLYENLMDKTRYLTFNLFQFHSLEELQKRTDMYKNQEQHRIIDLGLHYAGMGWSVVIFWDKQTRKVLYRFDGGSNGYDAMSNFIRYIGLSKKPTKDDDDFILDCREWNKEYPQKRWDIDSEKNPRFEFTDMLNFVYQILKADNFEETVINQKMIV